MSLCNPEIPVAPAEEHWLLDTSLTHEAGLEGPKVGCRRHLMQLINKNTCTLDENWLGLLQNSWAGYS